MAAPAIITFEEAVAQAPAPWGSRLNEASEIIPAIKDASYSVGKDKIPYFVTPIPGFNERKTLTIDEITHLYPWFHHTPIVKKKFKNGTETDCGNIQYRPGCNTKIRFYATVPDSPLTLFVDINTPSKYPKASSPWKHQLAWSIRSTPVAEFYKLKDERDLAFVFAEKTNPADVNEQTIAIFRKMAMEAFNPRYAAKEGYDPSVSACVNKEWPDRKPEWATQVYILDPESEEPDVFIPADSSHLRQNTSGIAIFELDNVYFSSSKYTMGLIVNHYWVKSSSGSHGEDVENADAALGIKTNIGARRAPVLLLEGGVAAAPIGVHS